MKADFLEHYRANGYAVVEGLLSSAEIDRLRLRMTEIAQGSRTGFPSELIEREPGGGDAKRKWAVRKINGCAEHDEVFFAHAAHARILDLVALLIGEDIKLFGSQCFMKPPGGIEKPFHQDSAYFCIDPRDLVTCWTALDDSTLENGCLSVIPGSHSEGLLAHDQPWMVGDRVDKQVGEEQIDRNREVPIVLKAGSASFHHSLLLHRSGPNASDRPRRGLAVHYMSARSRWTDPSEPLPDFPLLRGQSYPDCV